MQDVMIVLIIFSSISAVAITGAVTLYLTKKEKIKAQALIRSEEIRAKNRLEIEMLVNQKNVRNDGTAENISINEYGFDNDERRVRERQS